MAIMDGTEGTLSASALIEKLQLEKHPAEGGYFRRTYESVTRCVNAEGAERHAMTSIFYLLTDDAPEGAWHKNTSDIMHYCHGGGVIEYRVIMPDGQLKQLHLGLDVMRGQTFQLYVPGGAWKQSRLIEGPWCLLSEAVSPGFDFADHLVANAVQVAEFNAQFEVMDLS